MTEKPPIGKISDDDMARIQEKMLELGTEIGNFKAALASYQSRIRRTLVRLGDAEEQNVRGGIP